MTGLQGIPTEHLVLLRSRYEMLKLADLQRRADRHLVMK